MKTTELIGPALDWAVAKCEGFKKHAAASVVIMRSYSPSTEWSQGGPIIEREKIATYQPKQEDIWYSYPRLHHEGTKLSSGPTLLIAAMRCYVASKLGDEVEIPEELQ